MKNEWIKRRATKRYELVSRMVMVLGSSLRCDLDETLRLMRLARARGFDPDELVAEARQVQESFNSVPLEII